MGVAALQQQMFESINPSDLGQRSNNDLDLWYAYVFMYWLSQSKMISNDQELIQSDPTSYPQNQKGNN